MNKTAVIIISVVVAAISIFLICFSVSSITKTLRGENAPGAPKLIKCEIKVIQDGKPLEGATVSLVSANDNYVASLRPTQTDSNGIARIESVYESFKKPLKGAPRGKYKVLISKNERNGTDTIHLVDAKFRSMQSTPLEIDHKPSFFGGSYTCDVGAGTRFSEEEELKALLRPFKVTVLRDGKPAPGAEVELGFPQEYSSEKLRPGSGFRFRSFKHKGKTDQAGIATVATNETFNEKFFEGVPVGSYRVRLTYSNPNRPGGRDWSSIREKLVVPETGGEHTYDLNDLDDSTKPYSPKPSEPKKPALKLVPFKVAVLIGKTPVPKAKVEFRPKDFGRAELRFKNFSGITNEKGAAELKTANIGIGGGETDDGIPPAEYRVTILFASNDGVTDGSFESLSETTVVPEKGGQCIYDMKKIDPRKYDSPKAATPEQPKLHPFKIAVLNEKKPLENAMVSLVAKSKSGVYETANTTDKKGIVVFYSGAKERGSGVPPNEYEIAVRYGVIENGKVVTKTVKLEEKVKIPEDGDRKIINLDQLK